MILFQNSPRAFSVPPGLRGSTEAAHSIRCSAQATLSFHGASAMEFQWHPSVRASFQVSDPQTYVFMGTTRDLTKIQILMYLVHNSNNSVWTSIQVMPALLVHTLTMSSKQFNVRLRI